MPNDDNELALRAHIRELLLDYAFAHLTTDHVQYSSTITSDVLAKVLKPIPTHGPGELSLPVDPFETLRSKLKLDELTPYDEVWQPIPESIQLLKEMHLPLKRKLRSENTLHEDDEYDYESMPYCPMSPSVLSRFSRNNTPSLGKSKTEQTILAGCLASHGVRDVLVETLKEEDPVNRDECLDLKMTIDASAHASLLELHKKIPFLSRPVPSSFPAPALDFLRADSPEYEQQFKPLSPPVFSREQREQPSNPRPERNGSILGPLELLPLEVPESEPDFANASMKLIDGWATIPSCTSTPSLSSGNSEADELDEEDSFWQPSSSVGVPPAIEALHVAKIEEPIFSRSNRPGAGRTDRADERTEKGLLTFISKHLPSKASVRVRTDHNSDDTCPNPTHSPPSLSVVSLSMIGQPPSETDALLVEMPNDAVSDTLDGEVQRVLEVFGIVKGTKAYHDIIMDEPLDEKQTMFMEVPKLPPPNEYLRSSENLSLGERPSGVPRTPTEQQFLKPKFSLPATFKKVTGLKSLNLELSWRPFSYGSKVPTHAELVNVDTLFTDENGRTNEEKSSIEKVLADYALTPGLEEMSDNDTAEINFSHNLHMLVDVQSEEILRKPYPRFDPSREFNEDIVLLSRLDRLGLRYYPMHQAPQDTASEGSEKLSNSQSCETCDLSSAITPDLDSLLTVIRSANQIDLYADQDYEDLTTKHDRKKRRLTRTELDALCAMNNTTEPSAIAIVPRDLVSPRAIDNFDGSASVHCFPGPDPAPRHPPQTSFLPSQSQSLSLSLHDSQDVISAVAADTTLGSTGDDDGPCYVQERPPGSFEGSPPFQQSVFPSLQKVCQPFLDDCRQHHQPNGSVGDFESYLEDERSLRSNSQPRGIAPTMRDSFCGSGLLNTVQTEYTNLSVRDRLPMEYTASSACSPEADKFSWLLLLRGKKPILDNDLTTPRIESLPQHDDVPRDINSISVPAKQDVDVAVAPVDHSAPPDLLSDTRAFTIAEPWQFPTVQQTYLVSVDFVQYRALVRVLESPLCSARLIERDVISPSTSVPVATEKAPQAHSAEISVIVGPNAGVIFFPLSALPSQVAYKTLVEGIAIHSWRFSNILLVLTAFSRSQLIRTANHEQDIHHRPSLYSPPAMKAARRVRRDLALRDGTGEKQSSCTVELAFADSVEQAAMFVRAFADSSLSDSEVDFTLYIDEEEQEGRTCINLHDSDKLTMSCYYYKQGERDLAELEGMNAFCAAAILRCCTLEEFLELSPEERSRGLAEIIGKERIERVNAVLGSRMQAMDNMDAPTFMSPRVIPRDADSYGPEPSPLR